MGAAGSRAIATHLDSQGHHMAELERYTTANKIWAKKVKRLRLPDLFCLRCGLRVEARAKSKLEIKVSDSPSVPGRQWDANLRDQDLIGLVKCYLKDGQVEAATRAELFTVGALRASVAHSVLGPPKSASEGAERDRTWPANAPPRSGRVIALEPSRVQVEWDEGGRYSYQLTDVKNQVYVGLEEHFVGQEEFVVGSVEAPADLSCPGDSWNPVDDLQSDEATDRYAAVKALGMAGDHSAADAVRAIADADREDIRIRVEALGALGRLGEADAIQRLTEIATAENLSDGMPMEAVFILSELPFSTAADALVAIAEQSGLHEEIRAAATWGLGASGHDEPARLVPFIGDENDYVAVHAVVAAGSNLPLEVCEQASELLGGQTREAAAAARLLSNQAENGARVLVETVRSGTSQARTWALRGLGLAGREAIEQVAGAEDIVQMLEPMLVAESSFIDEDEVLKLLKFIEKQIAFNPFI